MTGTGEEGFTFIELLMAIVITTILLGSLDSAVIVILGSTTQNATLSTLTSDQASLDIWFPRDVWSSGSSQGPPIINGAAGTGTCSPSNPTVLVMKSPIYASSGSPPTTIVTHQEVDYVLQTGATPNVKRLLRYLCDPTNVAGSLSTLVLADGIDPNGGAAATYTGSGPYTVTLTIYGCKTTSVGAPCVSAEKYTVTSVERS